MSRKMLEDSLAYGLDVRSKMKFTNNPTTLGGNLVITADYPTFQQYDAGGSSRNITLPTRAAANDGLTYIFSNSSTAGENLAIKDAAATTILTVSSGGLGLVIGAGTSEAPGTRGWAVAQLGGEDLTVTDDLAVTGDLTTGGITYGQRVPIIADGAAVVLTSADSGGTVVMDKTDGSLTTLPEITASTVGMKFRFEWPVSYASGTQKIITGAAADLIVGTIKKFDTDTLTDPLAVESYNGTNHIAVVIDAVTDGGLLGSWLEFTAISATQWLIQGMLHHSGNVSASASTS